MRSVHSSRTVWMIFGALALTATPAMAGGSGVIKFSEAGYSLAEGMSFKCSSSGLRVKTEPRRCG
jgi:hypothetical protein